MTAPALSPETDRRLVALLVERGIAPRESVAAVEHEWAARRKQGAKVRTLAQTLCDRGVVPRKVAASLLQELRVERSTRRVGAPAAPAAEAPSGPPVLGPGSQLGPYRIVRELGRGGMGVVYRALDERLKREVALKTLSGLADLEARERFLIEARAAARLTHAGIVRVFGAETISSVPVIALELVEGVSLGARIKEAGPLSPHDAAVLVREVALAAHSAHEQGVVHRDLKPANILIDATGRARLTDFGLARDTQATGITETGAALGTPAYMAPEQATADALAIGPLTDVYGLGAVLYEALTGRPPFQGPNGIAVLRKVIEEEPESPSRVRASRRLAKVPRDLETVLLRAMEKKPARRYPTARALAEDLGRFAAGEPVLARPLGTLERAARWARRRPLVVALAFACLAAVVAPVAVLVARSRAESVAKQKAEEEERAALERRLADATRALASLAASARSSAPPILNGGGDGEFVTALVRALAEARSLELKAPGHAGVRALVGRTALELGVYALRVEEPGLAVSAFRECKDHAEGLSTAERKVAEAGERRATTLRWDLVVLNGASIGASNGDTSGALAALDDCIARAPDWAKPWHIRASVYYSRQRMDEALSDLDHALALEPLWVSALVLRSAILVERRSLREALDDAERAIAVDGEQVAGYLARANVRGANGDRKGAIADLERALECKKPVEPLGAAKIRAQIDAIRRSQ